MSNNYYPFSTAPGTHTSGAPVPSMLGHPSNAHHNPSAGNSNAGMRMDPMLPQLGANSPNALMSGSGGGVGGGGVNMMSYPVPPTQHVQQQQQQQRPIHTNRLNMGSGNVPAGFHASTVSVSSSVSVGTTSGGVAGVGGPAVPAPRSTAAFIADVTGAPPPPPARSRSSLSGHSFSSIPTGVSMLPPGGVSGTAGGGGGGAVHTSLLHMAPSPAATGAAVVAHTLQNVAPAGAGALPVSPLTTHDAAAEPELVSPSFQAFTTSAATMLATQGSAAAAERREGSMLGETAATRGGGGGHDASELPPFTRVEVQLTLEGKDRPDRSNASAEDARETTRDATVETGFVLDEMFLFITSLQCGMDDGDDDGGYGGMSHFMNSDKDEGNMAHYDFFSFNDLRKSAKVISTTLQQSRKEDNKLRLTLRTVTLAIVFGDSYEVVAMLSPREAVAVRYSLVHYLLTSLVESRSSQDAIDYIANALMRMMHLSLINVRSFVALVDTLLQKETLVSAALRLLAIGLHHGESSHNLRAALKTVPRIAQRLKEIYAHDPIREVDVALLTRKWDRALPILNCSLDLETAFARSSCPVTCMSYFGVRDELISGHMNGSVVLWGAPQMVREPPRNGLLHRLRPVIRPRGVVPLPLDCVPVGMAGQRMDGQYLAIASMPYKLRAPYNEFCETTPGTAPAATATAAAALARSWAGLSDGGSGGGEAHVSAPRRDAATAAAGGGGGGGGGGGAGVGAIIVITCNENSLRWNKGEVILRPAGVALTAITAFRNSIVAVGESVVNANPPPTTAAAAAAAAVTNSAATSSHHWLRFVDVSHGTVMRQIPQAHDDYITRLTVLDEGSYVLLSGGRDAALKLWDPRSREDSPVVNTALCTAGGHTTTISAMCTTGYNIVSSAVDGSLLVWDLRAMAAPQVQHKLDYPIVDLALIQNNTQAIAATSRGLIALSLDTLEPVDIRYNRHGFQHVLPNSTGELLFTASVTGDLSAMAVGASVLSYEN